MNYHDPDGTITHSRLEVFRKSPMLYKKTFLDQTVKPETTTAMLLGQVVHCLALEPDKFGDQFWVCDVGNRNAKAYKALAADPDENRTIILTKEYDNAQRIASAIDDNKQALEWLDICQEREAEIEWTYPIGDKSHKAKARIDALSRDYKTIVDIKTAADPMPEKWDRDCFQYGYHRQGAFYEDGLRSTVEDVCDWTVIFIVIGKSDPYHVFCRQLELIDIVMGRDENMVDLTRLVRMKELGDFRMNSETETTFVSRPGYYKG